VWGNKFVLKLMDRFPIVITFGAALLGWIAGDMVIGDVVVKPFLVDAPAGCTTSTPPAGHPWS
jgi:predicted tellurium resistance membrane protein TerC